MRPYYWWEQLQHKFAFKKRMTYKVRMEFEYELLQILEGHPYVSDIIKIYYRDKSNPYIYKPIHNHPSDYTSITHLKVVYTFPKMYVGIDKVINNWSYAFEFNVNEDVFRKENYIGILQIDNEQFPDGYTPYNANITQNQIDVDSKWWQIQEIGLFQFICSIGEILNGQGINPYATPINPSAYDYWGCGSGSYPINKIKWPSFIDLLHWDGKEQCKLPPIIHIGERKEKNNCIKFTIGNKK